MRPLISSSSWRRCSRTLSCVPDVWLAMLGLTKLGAVPIPATTLLTAKDIAWRAQAAEISAVLTDADEIDKAANFSGIKITADQLATGLDKASASFEPE